MGDGGGGGRKGGGVELEDGTAPHSGAYKGSQRERGGGEGRIEKEKKEGGAMEGFQGLALAH